MQFHLTISSWVIDPRCPAKRLQFSREPGHSIVGNLVSVLRQLAIGSGTTIGMVDTSGAPFGISVAYNCADFDAAITNDAWGLQVGGGVAAVQMTDYKLSAKILHGVGALNLAYSGSSISAPVFTGSKAYFLVGRNFSRVAAGSITVYETGLVARKTPATVYYWLYCRDVLATPKVVGSGQVLSVEYEIALTTS